MKFFTNQGWIGRATIMVVVLAVVLLSVTPRTTVVAANENVQVWLTLADGSKKLAQETDVNFTAGSGSGTVINVNPGTLYQKFEGAGAAMTDASAWLIANKLNTAQRNALMNNLFTRTSDGVGLSYLRIPMGASDFALNSYTYDDMPVSQTDPTLANFSISHDNAYIIPTLQAALALNPQLRFMGTPWSPPAWMKDNENLNAGALLPAYKQAFADYHVKFIQAYTTAGLPIDSITPQNEPMNATASYPSMGMSAAEQLDFIKNNLGPAFATAGLSTKILALDHNWDLTNYPLTILNDPAAAAYVDGTAFHCYAGAVANQSTVHNAYPDKGVWFTECSGGGWATDFGDNMSWNMKNLVIGNFRNWGKSLLLWNLALDESAGPTNGGCANCRGVVTIDSATGAVTYNEEYYILGHVTKFIDPGAYRAESTNYADGQPENVAFLNPDGSLSLIVHSSAASTFDVEWNGQHFTYALPAKGTATFKWDTGSTPGATATSAPTATAAPTATPYPAGPLQPFESEGTYYTDYQAVTSLTTSVVHGGASALQSFSDTGAWHTVGAYLNDRPINASDLDRICLWVYDTTAADNSMGFRLIDGTGASQELWSDNPVVGSNPKTVANTWVQMCFKLSAYSLVDLTKLDKVQMAMYWAGTYYFDDITGLAPAPTPTVTPTLALTATPTATGTATATPYPAGPLQPFENEGTYYNDYQVTPSLSTSVVHGGNSSLLSYSDTGAWHTVGAYFDNHPINATGYDRICLWVYDTTAADNDLAFKLFDASGASQEFWSSNTAIGVNSKTVQNTWVQMCFKLSAYNSINLAALDKVQIAVYWAGSYYFDDITGVAADPTPTVTPTVAFTATVTPTATRTATPYPAGALQPFETEGTYYNDYQVTPSLSTSVVHGGNSSLLSYSDTGAWHTVGAYFDNRPINATGYDRICLWVYDSTAADNDLAFKLFDASGASQEFWSSNTAIGVNSKTVANTWVQMCFNLSAYNSINLAALDKVQIAVYWAGSYYFDDVTGVAPESPATPTPTSTASPTSAASTNTPTRTPSPSATPTRTSTPTALAKTFNSSAALDGWVRESSETSGVGGSMNNTSNIFRLGDDLADRQYRAILSFNTGSIPNNALIQSAVLKIKKNGLPVGVNPFTVLGKLWVDIRRGTFGAAALELADFNAPATVTAVGSFNSVPVGSYYSLTLNATGRNNINKLGLTQFRLRFGKDDNDNLAADYMKFISGNFRSGQPQLFITYIIP